MRNNVVFPEPLGPIMQITSPVLMESDTSFSIGSPVKLLLILLIAIIILFSQRAIPDKCATVAFISFLKLYCREGSQDKQEKNISKVEKQISAACHFC
ncbi:hypothetical protein AB3X28_15840 [Raoultella terrigena]|uniref:hypothetical protein n=1 Tax=Raoultella terrigena TaxID=577 RepID=UPI001E4D8287|nr:hypothetical protein [Raoultella terrigena]